jgi:hypothetical protein
MMAPGEVRTHESTLRSRGGRSTTEPPCPLKFIFISFTDKVNISSLDVDSRSVYTTYERYYCSSTTCVTKGSGWLLGSVPDVHVGPVFLQAELTVYALSRHVHDAPVFSRPSTCPM